MQIDNDLSINGVEWFYETLDSNPNLLDCVKNLIWVRPENVDIKDRSNSVCYLLSREQYEEMFLFVDSFVNERMPFYLEKYKIPAVCYASIEALKYETGEHYVAHHDSGAKHVSNRVCSMVAYLNEDYEGGEIEFPLFNKKFKPSAGSVIIFPSNYPYLHVVHPVKNGTRYALNVFFSLC